MTVTSQTAGGVLQHDAISLPFLRPVAKPVSRVAPPSTPIAESCPVAPVASPATVPPTVESVQKLDLEQIGLGDKVVVRTANTTYNFEIGENSHAIVTVSKPAARSGETLLMGGTNADATEHTPHAVYVGGRMAFQFPDEQSAILTSVVESIFRVPAKKAPQA
jgi:hypothetical protein